MSRDNDDIEMGEYLVDRVPTGKVVRGDGNITFLRWRVILGTFMGYILIYVLRKPLSLAKSDMALELTLSPTDLGLLDTAFLLPYGLCAIFFSGLGDVHGANNVASLAMIGAALSYATIGALSSLFPILLASFFNGAFQAVIWPNLVKCVSLWLSSSSSNVYGLWSASPFIGAAISTWMGAWIIDSWGWRSLFFWPSVSVVLGAVFIKKYCADPLHYNVQALHLPTVANSTSSAVVRRLTTLQVFQVAGVVQLSMALFFAKMARYGLMLWLPYYSVTVLKFTPALGANLSLAFELGGAFGSPFAVVVCDRYLKSRLVTGVVLYQVLAAVSLVGFLFAGSDEVPLLFVLTTASGVALNSTDLLISGPIAAHIGRANGGIEASVGGVVNGMGSCGAIFQGLLIGWVSVSFGWDAVLKGAAGVSALAGLIAVSAARIEQLHSL